MQCIMVKTLCIAVDRSSDNQAVRIFSNKLARKTAAKTFDIEGAQSKTFNLA